MMRMGPEQGVGPCLCCRDGFFSSLFWWHIATPLQWGKPSAGPHLVHSVSPFTHCLLRRVDWTLLLIRSESNTQKKKPLFKCKFSKFPAYFPCCLCQSPPPPQLWPTYIIHCLEIQPFWLEYFNKCCTNMLLWSLLRGCVAERIQGWNVSNLYFLSTLSPCGVGVMSPIWMQFKAWRGCTAT